MSSVLAYAAEQIADACRVSSCSKEGCKISMNGLDGRRLLVDMDCEQLSIPRDQTRCDYIFIGTHEGNEWVAAMELKRGNIHEGEVRRQLQAGAEFAEARLVPQQAQPSFRPIAAYGGRLHKSQSMALKNNANRVQFRRKRYEIKLIRCGSPLVNALK